MVRFPKLALWNLFFSHDTDWIVPLYAPHDCRQYFHDFDLQTVAIQKNKQTLFEVTYKKTADQLAVKLRKKKQIAITIPSNLSKNLLIINFL